MLPLVIIGCRPESIKLAPLILALEAKGVPVVIEYTRQHPPLEMCSILQEFGVQSKVQAFHTQAVDFRGADESSLASRFAYFFTQVNAALACNKYTHVVVQGDTTSALTGALAGFYAKIPVVHVEAGLRTYAHDPWPEEQHRRMISQVASLHCAPTAGAAMNLWREKAPGRVVVTGNTAVDAVRIALKKPGEDGRPSQCKTILVTMHRRENWDRTPAMFRACEQLVEIGHPVRWVAHLNPQARNGVKDGLVKVIEPLGYFDMVREMTEAAVILTDSGGIQEEAPTLGKPVLILREKTERPEAVECGAAKLVGTDPAVIIREATRLLTDPAAYRAMQVEVNPFGDGKSSERIVSEMESP